jgi:uncharacterized membrane protein
MPPTLAAIALMVICGDGEWHWPWGEGWRRWVATVVVAVGGWLVAAPFHLSFHPPFQGIKTVHAWTPPLELLLWGGVLLIPVAAATWVMLGGILGQDDAKTKALATGLVALTVMAASLTGRPTLVVLSLILAVLIVAAVGTKVWQARPAVALAALGVFLLLVPEVVYVVDSYGEKLHRMNTIFKAYIQAWIFLAIALPALLYMGCRNRATRYVAAAILAFMALPHLLCMAAQPLTGKTLGLDGLAWLDSGDRAIVRYLRQQPHGSGIAEAVGGAYTEYARISSASGVPTVLGWANHELVWRGSDFRVETDRRRKLVDRIYRAATPAEVVSAVRDAEIDFVVIGAFERRDFDEASLNAIRRAGETVLSVDGGEVIRFAGDGP